MKFPEKLYESLTAEERARAFIEALSRLDATEVERLNDTCPTSRYVVEDWNYVQIKQNCMLVTLLVDREVSSVAEWAGATLLQLVCSDGVEAGEVEAILCQCIRRYRVATRAFDQFCREMGVKPDTMCSAYTVTRHPLIEVTERLFGDRNEAQADVVAVEEYYQSLRLMWGATAQ